MLSFVLKLRLKQIFIDSSNGLALGLRYLMMVFAFVYGILYGYLLNKVHSQNPLSDEVVQKLYAIMIIVFVISFVVKNYIPNYKGSTRFIHVVYPVSAVKRAWAHLINDVLSSMLIGFGIFYALLFIMVKPYTINSIPAMMLLASSLIIVERNFRRSLDFNLKNSLLHWILIAISLVGLVSVLRLHYLGEISFSRVELTVIYAVAFVMSFFHTMWIDASIVDSRERFQPQEFSKEYESKIPYLLHISWRQNKTKVTMLVAFGTKLFLMMIALLIGEKQGIMKIYQYLIFSPLLVGTQIFSNSFGFFRQFWLMNALYAPDRKQVDVTLSIFILSILSVDFVLSSVIMITGYTLSWKMVVYYLVSIPTTIQMALLSSYKYPFYVEKAITTANSANASPLIGFLVMGLMGLFGVLTHFSLLIWVSPLIFYLNYRYLQGWKKKQEKFAPLVYDKLFKG